MQFSHKRVVTNSRMDEASVASASGRKTKGPSNRGDTTGSDCPTFTWAARHSACVSKEPSTTAEVDTNSLHRDGAFVAIVKLPFPAPLWPEALPGPRFRPLFARRDAARSLKFVAGKRMGFRFRRPAHDRFREESETANPIQNGAGVDHAQRGYSWVGRWAGSSCDWNC